MDQMNELAFYTLAGAPESPRDLIEEVQQAEDMGIGNAFISERFNIKEAATLSGAVGAVSSKIGIATTSLEEGGCPQAVTEALNKALRAGSSHVYGAFSVVLSVLTEATAF